jgi:hypothetical protein
MKLDMLDTWFRLNSRPAYIQLICGLVLSAVSPATITLTRVELNSASSGIYATQLYSTTEAISVDALGLLWARFRHGLCNSKQAIFLRSLQISNQTHCSLAVSARSMLA